LGLGPIKLQASWVLLSDKTHILAISAGTSHSLLLTETGELLGCGNNQNGQLGLGPIENQASWIQLSDKTNIRAVAAGDFHSLLLTETGELFGCGDNRFGQLGLGNTQNQATWVKLNPFPKSHSLCHQRHLAFQSESLKVLLKRCDMLSQQHRAEDDTTQQQALFSEMKSSLQAQLTKPLPALWDQELNDLNVNEFNPFYHRLREHFNLAPAEESSSSNLLTM
jgi:hypothetical protein